MSSSAAADEYCLLFLGPALLGHPLLIPLLLLATASAFLLHPYPGGLAWSLSKKRRPLFSTRPETHSTIPGPAGAPFLGLVSAFTGPLAHRVLAGLAKASDAASLMAFSIGSTRFVISSQPDTAKEILGSSAFADRPVKESAYELLFHRAMGFAPYGDYWRSLRRISATHLFSPLRVARFGGFRREIGRKMVREIEGLMGQNGVVEVKRVLHFGSLNNVMMSVFGKRYEFCGNEEGEELEGLVSEGYELLGIFNWSDHFPLMGRLDLHGVRRRCKALVERVNVFVGRILDEHKMKRIENDHCSDQKEEEIESSKDFVDVLLDLDGENKLSESDMIAVLWEMIFRGTDTVAILLEWVLARMVLHPDIQAKAQAEIDAVIGTTGRDVQDSDLLKLPYLSAIIKETLRMHPPGPLLSWARLSTEDTHVGPHFVPAGTTAMVNMWSITHDPSVWPEPDEFNPERFMEKDVAVMGSDLRLAPFGAGRRVCPGKAMGLVTVHLWLAQLLQNFKWVAGEKGVDLSEVLNLSMEMKNALVCKAIPRSVSVAAAIA